ncbi:unnamed protein product [Effrenium voratum]|nr:unnamed protein product [Effrenium voratum]
MARRVMSLVMVAAAIAALLSRSMSFLAAPKEVPRTVIVPAAAMAPLMMSGAAYADTASIDSEFITPTYQAPEVSPDLGYLLFFFAISVVGIARNVFSKTDVKSLGEAVSK